MWSQEVRVGWLPFFTTHLIKKYILKKASYPKRYYNGATES